MTNTQLEKELEELRKKVTKLEKTKKKLKQAESALRESQERITMTLEGTDQGVWDWDVSTGEISFDENWARVLGYEPGEMKFDFKWWDESVHPDSVPVFEKALEEYVEGRSKYYELEYQIRSKEDGWKWIWARGVSVEKDNDGKPLRMIGTHRDITLAKHANEALRQSEERFRNTVEGSLAGYFRINREGLIESVNDAWLKMHKYSSRDEVIGKHFAITQVDEDLDLAKKLVKQLFDGETIPSGEFSRRCKDGSVEYHSFSANPVSEGDEIVAIEGFLIDTTKQKLAEKELKDSEERFKCLSDASLEGVGITDKGKILDVNKAFLEMYKCKREDVIGKSVMGLLSPEYRDLVMKNIREGYDKPYEQLAMRQDGSKFYIETCGRTIPYKGKTVRVTAIRDIDERKRTEIELAKSKAELSAILDNAPLIMMLVDSDKRVQQVNEAVVQFTGQSPEEMVGLRGGEALKCIGSFDDPRGCGFGPECETCVVRLTVLDTFETGNTHHGVEGSLTFDVKGKHVKSHFLLYTVLVEVMDEKKVLVCINDISERKRMEEELVKAQKLESVGVLAGGIAHDFNNILASLWGNLSLALMDIEPGSEVAELISEAEKACARAKSLTAQLLTFAKGGAPIKKTMSISSLIKDSCKFTLRGSKVNCNFDISKDLWIVDVDEGQFNQVINNIVINAMQSMPEGGSINLSAKNQIINPENRPADFPLEDGRYISISIEDKGVGIKEEHISKIFDPYFSTKQEGSGLGLATCYSIINKHGGHISVESISGKGATFHIYLPASDKDIQEQKKKTGIKKGHGKILVMDDEEQLKEISGKMLEYLGYHVELASNGLEAISVYKKAMESGEPFSAVILDLTIPGAMGGQECIKRLLELDPAARAIVSSGYSNDPVLANYQDYGFKGVIAKPFTIENLSNMVDKVIS